MDIIARKVLPNKLRRILNRISFAPTLPMLQPAPSNLVDLLLDVSLRLAKRISTSEKRIEKSRMALSTLPPLESSKAALFLHCLPQNTSVLVRQVSLSVSATLVERLQLVLPAL